MSTTKVNSILQKIQALNKKDWIFISVILLLLFVIGFMSWSSDKPQIEDMPGSIDVTVPPVNNKSDTVFMPVEVMRDTTIYKENRYDKVLADKYKASQDSIEQLNLYIQAITERDYKINFKDEYQNVAVTSKVRGELLEQSLEYDIHERTVKFDTVFKVEVKKQRKLFALVELGAPLQIKQNEFIGKGTLIFKNKKDQLFSASIDTEAQVWVGAGVKF